MCESRKEIRFFTVVHLPLPPLNCELRGKVIKGAFWIFSR
jgi:hypothetical protein